MNIRRLKSVLFISVLLLAQIAFGQYNKQTYQNDPMGVIHYTLDNGLQVYMSVNKLSPRIQTYIAVRVGSKNDPKESTGLSHYLEHLMFKGTTHFGTLDYKTESIYLAQIDSLYEIYNHTTDQNKRANIYHQIDSVSYIASKYAISNEYDKLMSIIGSDGTNAFTSNDMTVYQENIPSNELERWAEIEADRFQNPVFRLFHTELEAVYEEKNMNMANDTRTAMEQMNLALYPNHPYGTQTTIGTIEHLKNPSLKNIKKHFSTYYVPNNYAICLAGDFDPDKAIEIINKYFGQLQPKYIPDFTYTHEMPIQEVKTVEVTGLEPEHLRIGYRLESGNGSRDIMLANMTDAILNNGNCGLIDININQKQLASRANSGVYDLNDYSSFMLVASPKQGQSLEELKDLLLEQINILKSGSWDESLLTSAINNKRLEQMFDLENSASIAMQMAYCYLAHRDWQDVINETEQLKKITKQDIVDFANRVFKDNNYVVLYKRQGAGREVAKVVKPPITPIVVNRDVKSDFLKKIENTKTNAISPVFTDYSKITKAKVNNTPLLYVHNNINGRFELEYRFDYGYLYSKINSIFNSYTPYLHSDKYSLADINKQMYALACSYSINFGPDKSRVRISGLSENMDKAIEIVESIINHPIIDEKTVKACVENSLKNRADNKSKQNAIFQNLMNYVLYSPSDRAKTLITNDELKAINPTTITNEIKNMLSQKQIITYYGDKPVKDVENIIVKEHKTNIAKKQLKPIRKADIQTLDNQIYFVNYDSKQSLCRQFSNSVVYDQNNEAIESLYNEYFGGSMNCIVFQEIREKRSLAYSAGSRYIGINKKGYHNYNFSHIGTQNDKVPDALAAFCDLFDNMPISEHNFAIAKQALIVGAQTKRTTDANLISNYLWYQERGLTNNEKKVYEQYQTLTLKDLIAFNNKYIKSKKRATVILGNEKDLDFKALAKYGKVNILSLEQVFGY